MIRQIGRLLAGSFHKEASHLAEDGAYVVGDAGEHRTGGDGNKAGQQRVLHHVLASLVEDKPHEGTV